MNFKTCICIAFALLLGGCAASAPNRPPPVPLFNDAAFAPPSVPTDAHDLFTLTPAMRDYLASPAFKAIVRAKGERHGLVEALYKKGDLKLEYDADLTRNAGQTFDAKAGNCMSLVIMTAAFARELKLEVHFQNVLVREQWSRVNDLNVGSTHINLGLSKSITQDMLYSGYEPDQHMLVIDFVPPNEASRLRNLPLEEDEVVAMYMNNRATEALSAGKIDDAYWWARSAVIKMPRLANGYNTLGVIYRSHGDLAHAEHSFRDEQPGARPGQARQDEGIGEPGHTPEDHRTIPPVSLLRQGHGRTQVE
jgi:hypothetical protein